MHSQNRTVAGSAAASSVSTLTASTSRPLVDTTAEETPQKRARLDYFESPSPKKAVPDFEHKPSDDYSVLSGDDSQGWLLEEERMAAVVTEQNREESAEADKEIDAGIAVCYDWEDMSDDNAPGDDAPG